MRDTTFTTAGFDAAASDGRLVTFCDGDRPGWRLDGPDGWQPARLDDVVVLLSPGDAAAAVAAHLAAIDRTARHLDAVVRLHAGVGVDDAVCVACITDPSGHADRLDLLLDELARELVDAAGAGPVRLHVDPGVVS